MPEHRPALRGVRMVKRPGSAGDEKVEVEIKQKRDGKLLTADWILLSKLGTNCKYFVTTSRVIFPRSGFK